MATGKILDEPLWGDHLSAFGDTMFASIEKTQEARGVLLGHRGHNGHPYIVPWGFYKLLKYIHLTWKSPEVSYVHKELPIYVTENGYAEEGERHYSVEDKINDTNRIK